MKAIPARIFRLLIVGALMAAPAAARELAPELASLLEHFQENRRVALAYLRTDNVELGAAQIETLRDRWLADRHAAEAQAAADARLAAALADTERLILASVASIDALDAERAFVLVEASAAPLRSWRAANGIRLFSDCIAEIGAAYESLDRYRSAAPSLGAAAVRDSIVVAATRVAEALARCDHEAPARVRDDPKFRRLVEGMTASLRQVPQAIGNRDGAYLHRLLIEQRSFERLLAFHYG